MQIMPHTDTQRNNQQNNSTQKHPDGTLERLWQNYSNSLKADPFDLGQAVMAWFSWVTAFVPGDGARFIPLPRLLIDAGVSE